MTFAIKISRLSYAYHDAVNALDDVSLSIESGEKVALIGPNGAGKSTLLLHLNGTLLGEGQVSAGGVVVSSKTLRIVRRKVGLIFQDPSVQLFCPTVYDDVAFGPLHFETDKSLIRARVMRALSEVDMCGSIDRSSHHLSMGEKRRISIASVLSFDPEILALDEPAAMLDPKRRRWLINFVRAVDKTIVLATHDLQFALETCSRTILMNAGRVVADGKSESIISDKKLLDSNDLECPYQIESQDKVL